MALLGNSLVSKHPCTEQDEMRNWQIVQSFQQIVNQFMEGPPGGDAHTVLATADDSTPSTLHDAIQDHSTYVNNVDIIVNSATVGAAGTDQTERLFVNMSNSHGGSGTFVFTVIDGLYWWVPYTLVSDSLKVKVSTADTTEHFLHDSMATTGTYESGEDIPVTADINTPGGNEKLQLFIQVDAITGYSNTGAHALSLVDNVPTFVDLSAYVGSGTVQGYATDIGRTASGSVDFDPTEIQGFAATWQFFMHLSGDSNPDGVTSPHWNSVSGYDATDSKQVMIHTDGTWSFKTIAEFLNLLPGYAAGSDQIIGHAANGDTEWKTLVEQDINNPTSVELNLGATLESKLNYEPVTVKLWPAADVGDETNFSDSVAVTSCPA